MENRKELIKQIEEKRKSKVLTYIAATRQGLGYEMQQMDIRVIYEHLLRIGSTEKIDLIINSYGGDVTFPWRLVPLIREYCDEFNVIIPMHAFSAATLVSLGADAITMLPAACLGPTDPQSTNSFNPKDGMNYLPISVEDINSYVRSLGEDFELKSESSYVEALKLLSESESRVHPLALGNAKRVSQLAKKYSRELLSTHKKDKLDKDKVEKIVNLLGSELFAHDHPINRQEAHKHGLNIVNESVETETLIWDLYKAYEDEMDLTVQFDLICEFKKKGTQIPLSQANTISPIEDAIGPIKMLIIEDSSLTDSCSRVYSINALKFLNNDGEIKETYTSLVKSQEWTRTESTK